MLSDKLWDLKDELKSLPASEERENAIAAIHKLALAIDENIFTTYDKPPIEQYVTVTERGDQIYLTSDCEDYSSLLGLLEHGKMQAFCKWNEKYYTKRESDRDEDESLFE